MPPTFERGRPGWTLGRENDGGSPPVTAGGLVLAAARARADARLGAVAVAVSVSVPRCGRGRRGTGSVRPVAAATVAARAAVASRPAVRLGRRRGLAVDQVRRAELGDGLAGGRRRLLQA